MSYDSVRGARVQVRARGQIRGAHPLQKPQRVGYPDLAPSFRVCHPRDSPALLSGHYRNVARASWRRAVARAAVSADTPLRA